MFSILSSFCIFLNFYNMLHLVTTCPGWYTKLSLWQNFVATLLYFLWTFVKTLLWICCNFVETLDTVQCWCKPLKWWWNWCGDDGNLCGDRHNRNYMWSRTSTKTLNSHTYSHDAVPLRFSHTNCKRYCLKVPNIL